MEAGERIEAGFQGDADPLTLREPLEYGLGSVYAITSVVIVSATSPIYIFIKVTLMVTSVSCCG